MIYRRFDKTGYEIKGYEFLSVRVMRSISIPIARKLSIISFPPEVICVTSLILVPVSALFFAFGQRHLTFIAGILLFVAWVLDFIDGDLARIQKRDSSFGAWLDSMAGKICEVIIIPSICFAIYQNTQDAVVWVLGFVILGGIYFSAATNTKTKLMAAKKESHEKTDGPSEMRRSLVKAILHEATIGGDIPFYAIILGALFNKMFLALLFSALYVLCYSIYTIYATHKKVIELDR